jgi:hypothetical protein
MDRVENEKTEDEDESEEGVLVFLKSEVTLRESKSGSHGGA